jgi:hypothetical protein
MIPETHPLAARIGRTYRHSRPRGKNPVRTLQAVERRPWPSVGITWQVGYTVPGDDIVIWTLSGNIERWIKGAVLEKPQEQTGEGQ